MIRMAALLLVWSWLWTVWRGFGIGILCGVLNFFFPPLSQLIFSLYEKRMRLPTLLMFASFVLLSYAIYRELHFDFLQEMYGHSGGTPV